MAQYTIIMFPKIQVDTVIAFFLLKRFGDKKYPGIVDARIDFWSELPEDKNADELEQDGFILIDLGNGRFDHHRLGEENKKFSASHLVAQELEIDDLPQLQKLLEFARRDDLEGRGTSSSDPIDRAFGLPGMLANLNKLFSDQPKKILELILPLIDAHYIEQTRRYEHMPKALEELRRQGKVREFSATQLGKNLKVVYIESDDPAMAGYLRSRKIGAHIVIQKANGGHTNLITLQRMRIQLQGVAKLLKMLEAEKNGLVLQVDSLDELEKAGRTEGLPHWYYDTRANTIQNGGVNPQDIPPTKLTFDEIVEAVKKGLNIAKSKGQPRGGNYKISYGRGAMYIE